MLYDSHATFSIEDLILPDHDLCLYLVQGLYLYGAPIIWSMFSSLQKHFEKVCFAAAVSSVSVADNAKRGGFDVYPDLDLICDQFKKNSL